jgi:N-acetylglucosaminyl-diphospho-decaprenol L-rhamnosyltransferase
VSVDVVIVSYRSGGVLRNAVQPLAGQPDLSIFVVDNASGDASLGSVSDLPVTVKQLDRNLGFAAGCNVGWRLGSAPYVLFLNPDARTDWASVRRLAAILEREPSIGIVAPLIRNADGDLEYSQRRFPRPASTFAEAFFLHRLLPNSPWTGELVRDPDAYRERHSVDWVSGACLLVRRDLLERLGGWDERFFMYCEDVDLCRRVRDLGFDVVFAPESVVVHSGGASAPRAELLPVLALSKVRYARKHAPAARAALERVGVVVSSVTHALASSRGRDTRRGYLRAAVRVVVGS